MLTMLLVIIGHSNYYHIASSYGGVYNSDFVCSNDFSIVYRCLRYLVFFIYTFHMPLFMALSGMLFSFTLRKNVSFAKLVKDKSIRLLLPFFAVSLLLSIPIKYISGYWSDSDNVISDIFFGQLLLMGNSHLWYVIALFWIFLVYYFIETYKSQKNIFFWFILLCISWIGWFIEPKNDFLGLPAAMKHLFFFAVGYNFLSKTTKSRIKVSYVVMGLCCLFFFSTLLNFLCNHYPDDLFLRLIHPVLFTFFALIGIYLMCLLSQLLSRYSGTQSKIVPLLKNNTYELYLYSDPFNYLLIYIGWIIWDKGILVRSDLSIAMFLIRAFCTTLFAIITIYVVRYAHLKDLTKAKYYRK